MKQVFVRQYDEKKDDTVKLNNWLKANPAYDPKAMSYSNVFVSYDKSGPTAVMPIQTPVFMEAVGFRAGLSEEDQAFAMRELCHTAIFLSQGEVYFLGSDERTNKFAERQGFTKVEMPVYRVRKHELEGL